MVKLYVWIGVFEVTEKREIISVYVSSFDYQLEAPIGQLDTTNDLVYVPIDPLEAHYIDPLVLSPLLSHESPLLTYYMILFTHFRSLQTY